MTARDTWPDHPVFAAKPGDVWLDGERVECVEPATTDCPDCLGHGACEVSDDRSGQSTHVDTCPTCDGCGQVAS